MFVWREWTSRKFAVIDGKRYKVYFKGLFLFGFIPLYIKQTQATFYEGMFDKH